MDIKNLVLGKKIFQPFFEFLFRFSIKGMNYDRGHVPSANGEKFALQYVTKNTSDNKMIIFDVGANSGQYTQMAVSQIKKKLSIVRF